MTTGSLPLPHPLPPVHCITLPHHRMYFCLKKQRMAVYNSLSLVFSLHLCVFLLFPILHPLFSGVYWLLIFSRMVVLHSYSVLRAFISSCVQPILLYNRPFPLLLMGAHGYIGTIPPPSGLCMYVPLQEVLPCAGHSSISLVVIYFVVNIALSLSPTIALHCHYLLSRCSHVSRNQCISVRIPEQCLFARLRP